jgi:hypothetical protein
MQALLDRLSLPVGDILSWKEIRDEIWEMYPQVTIVERETLLRIHKLLMDTVEQNSELLPSEALAEFRETQKKDYRWSLIQEALLQDGNVSPAILEIVTAREVAAKRMGPDDELRRIALKGFEERIATKSALDMLNKAVRSLLLGSP